MRAPFAVPALALLLTGCASIVNGSTQPVSFISTPAAARVIVDGNPIGSTPVVHALSRKKLHAVRFELDGYQPYEMALSRSVSGWVWGNIVFGGLIGLAVDAGTGGMYKLSPEQVSANLSQRTAKAETIGDGLFITLVMQPDPSWEKIGQLDRE